MATDNTRLGNAIVSALQGAGLYPADANAAQLSKSKAEWATIAQAILTEIKTNMEIDLSSGDILVGPGSFSTPTGAVTGIAISQSVSLMGKLK